MRAVVACCLLSILPPAGAAADPDSGTGAGDPRVAALTLATAGYGGLELGAGGSFGGLTTQQNPTRPTGLLKGAFVAVACDGVGRILRRRLPDEYDNVQTIATTKATLQRPGAVLRYEDPDWPLQTELGVSSPAFPAPVLLLRLRLENPSTTSRRVRVALAWPNTIGFGAEGEQEFALAVGRGAQPTLDGLRYIAGESVPPDVPRGAALGEYYLAAGGLDDLEPLTGWDDSEVSLSWWQPFAEGRTLPFGRGPSGALTGWCEVPAGRSVTVDYALVWSFPANRAAAEVGLGLEELARTAVAGRRPRPRVWGHPATRWQARAVGDGLPAGSDLMAPLAFDGIRDTHWSTLRPMQAGDAFELDFGQVLKVSRVDLDPGDARREFPRGLRLEVSTDGVQWRALTGVAVLTADDGSVRATFPTQQTRRLRLVNLGTATDLPWSVAEVYVLP